MNLEDEEEEEEMNLDVEKKKIENEKMKIENEKKEINKMKEEIKNERERYKEELLKKERERSRMIFLYRVNIFENRKKEPNISTSFGSFSGKSISNKNPAPHNPDPAPYNPPYNPNYNPLYNPFLQDSLPSLSELDGQYLNVRQNQEQINLLRRISNSINRNLRFGTLTQIIILVAFILYFVCISYNFYRYEGFQHKTTSSLFYLILGVFLMVCVIFIRNIYESMKKIDNK